MTNFALCSLEKGKVPPKMSGYVRSIAMQSRQIAEDGGEPIVCVEHESCKILIMDQNDEMTVAIFKSK